MVYRCLTFALVAQSADAANRCALQSARDPIVSSRAGESPMGCADSPAHETELSSALRCPLEFLPTATGSEVAIWNITDWRKAHSLPATNASLSFSHGFGV